MALTAVGDGLVEHQVTDGTLQLIVHGIDEEGVDAHGFIWMLGVLVMPCLAALEYVGLWVGEWGGMGEPEAADY